MYYTEDFDEIMMEYLLYTSRIYSDRGWSIEDDVLLIVTDTIAQTANYSEINNKMLEHITKLNKEESIKRMRR